ncbi:glutamate/gamma-aminobutyrate family transporter YjeM [Nicoliella spurrieriana]|uniref:Glutamate/gamma-aminobutyrate family transporter YjeM n=1 Tax=Nicoliella spurrieriana TaxID=2925830 RepID=A0A976RRT9_9LACO|nr:glutamate/gamma-aminobutyrate family transporter YjeM [Nicoliella spurrieriana]UQS86619.1 glutamate/gamma-aminobutyrate family transporter YjeM [Nicoliella spurrieriana]
MANSKRISLTSLVLMILSTTFGFINIPTAFDQMGYASIIWYVVGALAFFLPSSFMFAEYGAALKDESGGIYSWIKSGLGERWAFIGGFAWLSALEITILFSVPNLWVSLSATLFGHDTTQRWHLLGFNSTQTLGLLSISFILLATMIATKGLGKITWIASIGGFLGTLIAFIFCILSIVIIFLNHGHLAQPIDGFKSLLVSPNPSFQDPIATISFVIYAIFAYAGVESLCGVINHLKTPSKTFPRGVVISAIIIFILYTISIILCGFVVNWKLVMGKNSVTLGNVMYVLMANLGMTLGHGMGLSQSATMVLSNSLTRYTGFSTLMGGVGSFFVFIYSPLKSFMFGANKRIWPKWALHLNPHDMPSHAMWIQSTVLIAILFFISFGGDSAKAFFQILTDMNNVSTAFQYILIVLAFPFFKRIENLNRPFIFYHQKRSTWFATILVLFVLSFGIIFNFIQPILDHSYMTDFWTFLGPVVFGGGAWLFYDLRIKSLNN